MAHQVLDIKESLSGLLEGLEATAGSCYGRLVFAPPDDDAEMSVGESPPTGEIEPAEQARGRILVQLYRQYNLIAAALWVKYTAELDAISHPRTMRCWGQPSQHEEERQHHRRIWDDAIATRLNEEELEAIVEYLDCSLGCALVALRTVLFRVV